MTKINLDLTYVDNTIRTSNYELRFKYNTENDYFYFDLYSSDGTIVKLHNKVVTGYDYKTDGEVYFTSNTYQSYATKDNVTSFTAVTSG